MIFGVLMQKTGPGAVEAPFNFRLAKKNETMEQVATQLEQLADQNRRTYPQYEYRTLLGEITHEIEGPKPPVVKVKPLVKIKKV